MSAHWHIGMEVECIANNYEIHPGEARPVVGGKYTIRDIEHNAEGAWLFFREIVNPVRTYSDGLREICFWVGDFRPVQKRPTSIAIFTALLNPSREQADKFIAADQAKHSKEAAEALAQALYGEVKFQ